jgi:hypothetical protein
VTRLHAVYLGICGLLLAGLVGAGVAYKISTVRAEEQQKASDKVLAAKDQALSDRDKAFADFKAQMLQQIADIKTAKQATVILNPVVQPAGQIAPQQVTKADLSPDVQKQLPGAPDARYTLFTDPQMVLLGQREKSCQLTEAGLTKCEADRADYLAQIAALKKANAEWAKAGKVGPWIAGLGAAKNAAGNGYTPTVLFGRRITNNLGIIGGVQGRGDLSLWATWNFGK